MGVNKKITIENRPDIKGDGLLPSINVALDAVLTIAQTFSTVRKAQNLTNDPINDRTT
jgi:hypothetical protein